MRTLGVLKSLDVSAKVATLIGVILVVLAVISNIFGVLTFYKDSELDSVKVFLSESVIDYIQNTESMKQSSPNQTLSAQIESDLRSFARSLSCEVNSMTLSNSFSSLTYPEESRYQRAGIVFQATISFDRAHSDVATIPFHENVAGDTMAITFKRLRARIIDRLNNLKRKGEIC